MEEIRKIKFKEYQYRQLSPRPKRDFVYSLIQPLYGNSQIIFDLSELNRVSPVQLIWVYKNRGLDSEIMLCSSQRLFTNLENIRDLKEDSFRTSKKLTNLSQYREGVNEILLSASSRFPSKGPVKINFHPIFEAI